jgi:hypothetical protein
MRCRQGQGQDRTGDSTTIRGMIAGAHAIIFAEDAEQARAFVREVLGFEGWMRATVG